MKYGHAYVRSDFYLRVLRETNKSSQIKVRIPMSSVATMELLTKIERFQSY